jgi:hypothetical protein
MKAIAVSLLVAGVMVAAPGQVSAKGCLKGALIGGAAGHLAGHGVLGAAAGCVIGHHEAKKQERQRLEKQNETDRQSNKEAVPQQ